MNDEFFNELNNIKNLDSKIKEEMTKKLESKKRETSSSKSDENLNILFKEMEISFENLQKIREGYLINKSLQQNETNKRINMIDEIKNNYEKLKEFYEDQISQINSIVK